jgi:hypothetical protein
MKDLIREQKEMAVGMSSGDLKKLGLEEVAYIKKYKMDDGSAWVVHAADGTALAVQKTPDAAILSAQYQELDIVSLH